jgi:hypothetical protein
MTESFFISKKATVPTLILQGEWTSSAAQYMREHGLIGLRLSGYLGWRSSTLDFLREVPFLEYLDILTTKLQDITGLYALKELSYLTLEGRTPPLDFSRLPRLRTLALGRVSPQVLRDLGKAQTIRKLALTHPKPNSLQVLGQLPALEEVGISSAQINDLSFASFTPCLRRLSLVMCNSMKTLAGLQNAGDLIHFSIEQAKSLSDISSLSHLARLRTLILKECPNIESISPLKSLPSLESVELLQTTNVKDGDLSPLLTMPKLRNVNFIDRLHYSNRNAEFPKELAVFK